MISSPCGRFVASAPALRQELALGVDLTLESTEREIAQVRDILRGAVDRLMADQLLASASRRIRRARSALGHEPDARHDTPAAATRAAGRPAESF